MTPENGRARSRPRRRAGAQLEGRDHHRARPPGGGQTTLGTVSALNGVNSRVKRGSVLGVVGESGSGKSVTARAIMQILERAGRITQGSILFRRPDWATAMRSRWTRSNSRRRLGDSREIDIPVWKPTSNTMRAIRGSEIAMIFQEPMSSLNPVYTVGAQIQEAIQLHQNPGQEGVMGSGDGHAEPGRDAEPGKDRELLPARAVGRHAATRHDRHGPLLSPCAADRRRADHGAGRDDGGADPGHDAPPPGRDRHVDPVRHPQPGRGRPDV